MRHRIGGITGFGNAEPCSLDNNITLGKSEFWDMFLQDCQDNFKTIANYCGFDLSLSKDCFAFGIEPSYQYDDLQIIYIDLNNKSNCAIREGRAWGFYGSHTLTKIRYYKDYKKKSKFIRFIDKWYDDLVEKLKELQRGEREWIR
jgi:hypothetical protein